MNKYKMTTICSLSIVCILILSLLLPLTTSANDEESIELKMHYENTKVTVNIAVNSEVYTGVVCKYIEVDNVYTSDNLVTQTKETGTVLNLNKTEGDNYNTIIENVSKRYVVIYVSIGNCDICDYIDCNLNNSEQTRKETKSVIEKESNNQNTTEENVKEKEEVEKNITSTQDNENNNNQDNNIKTEQNNANKDENDTITNQNENNNDDKIVVESNNVMTSTDDFQTIDEDPSVEQPEESQQKTKQPTTTSTKQNNTSNQEQTQNKNLNNQTNSKQEDNNNNNITSNNKEQQNSNNEKKENSQTPIDLQNFNKDTINVNKDTTKTDNNTINVVDKETIDQEGFEEIPSIDKVVSTADGKIPQTGENDTIKIIGITVFSAIAMISFYKYKQTK